MDLTQLLPILTIITEKYPLVGAGIISIASVFYIIRMGKKHDEQRDAIQAIKHNHFEDSMNYIEGVLDSMELDIIERAEKFLSDTISVGEPCVTNGSCLVDKLKADIQLFHFRAMLQDTKGAIKHKLKGIIRRNGFHKKTGEALNEYIVGTTNAILVIIRKKDDSYASGYPTLGKFEVISNANLFDYIASIIKKDCEIIAQQTQAIKEVRSIIKKKPSHE